MVVATCKARGPSDSFVFGRGGGGCSLGRVALGWDIQLFFAWEKMDGVVATHHVLESGVLVMTWGWFAASHGGVGWVDTQSMQPAVSVLGGGQLWWLGLVSGQR